MYGMSHGNIEMLVEDQIKNSCTNDNQNAITQKKTEYPKKINNNRSESNPQHGALSHALREGSDRGATSHLWKRDDYQLRQGAIGLLLLLNVFA